MLARLGHVLYWVGCIFAALTIGAGALVWVAEGRVRSDGATVLAGFAVCAVVIWLIGMACRYVLSGPAK